MIGYFGSKGSHLSSALNLNQFVNGVRPFPTLSSTSPIFPAQCVGKPTCPLGNITEQASIGNSNYNALWVTANKNLGKGLQFNASYTWSKSLDYNSRNFQGLTLQDSLNPRGDYGLSDFDVRNRFVISTVYELPFKGNRLFEGWRVSGVIQLQSGNPLNVTTGLPPLPDSGTLATGHLRHAGNCESLPDGRRSAVVRANSNRFAISVPTTSARPRAV